jgi:hypothetical protein
MSSDFHTRIRIALTSTAARPIEPGEGFVLPPLVLGIDFLLPS